MDGLEEKLTSFLSDPSAMEQILSMARTLGLGGDSAPSAPAPENAPRETPVENADSSPGAMEDPMLRSLVGIMLDASRDSGRQTAVLNALRPFVRHERREKIDRAAQIAKMAHIAGVALKNLEKKP